MRLAPLLCALLALGVGCSSGGGSAVENLEGIGDLRAQFNRDVGDPRLILLLSPS